MHKEVLTVAVIGLLLWGCRAAETTRPHEPETSSTTLRERLDLAAANASIGSYANYPRRPATTLEVRPDGTYSFVVDDAIVWTTCADTMAALPSRFTVEGRYGPASLIGFYEDHQSPLGPVYGLLTADYHHTLAVGDTVLERLWEARLTISAYGPCQVARARTIWLHRTGQ